MTVVVTVRDASRSGRSESGAVVRLSPEQIAIAAEMLSPRTLAAGMRSLSLVSKGVFIFIIIFFEMTDSKDT